MTDDATWIRLLDAEPDNWQARLEYSDWLQERGDGERAAGQRFQVQYECWPCNLQFNRRKFHNWSWYTYTAKWLLQVGSRGHVLVPSLWELLRAPYRNPRNEIPAHKLYRTRHLAELALAAALPLALAAQGEARHGLRR